MLCARPGTSATSHSHVCLESADTKKWEARGRWSCMSVGFRARSTSQELGAADSHPTCPHLSVLPALVVKSWALWSGQLSLCQRTLAGLLTVMDGCLGSVAGVSGFLRSVKS